MVNYKAFTLKSEGLLQSINTDVLVTSDLTYADDTEPRMWNAIWDTGASKSSINKNIVDYLKLIPIGRGRVGTANGVVEVNTYNVNIGLPNGVTVSDVIVSCSDLGADVDMLIGMDIIRYGDFSITNKNGRTTFSFRIPSVEEVDFVAEAKREGSF